MMENSFSMMSQRLKSSIIRELLRDTGIVSLISFGGGAPDPETFDREALAEISKEVILKEYVFALQYGPTEGDPILKDEYIKVLKERNGIDNLKRENMLITTGSQQALDLMGRILLDTDSYVIVGHPVYLGAISAFRAYGPKFIPVEIEEDGFKIDQIEEEIKRLDQKGELKKLKFIYAVPNFDNPSGVTLSLEKRKALADLAVKYNVLILEDDPYGELRYEGERIPSIYKIAEGHNVVLLNTLSKVMSPGLRIGLIVGESKLVSKAALAKQGVDLCTPGLTQRIAARYLQKGTVFERINETIKIYRSKKNKMLNALQKYVKVDGSKWTKPAGGLFIWLELPKKFDTMEMFEKAKKAGVAYIPGAAFYVDDRKSSEMRLSFCLPSEDEIEEGIKRIGHLIDTYR
ncbi:aminotransferase-like domain-containing protein [Athalassotoga saccharophila]|uniref:aminotransferase-like domain-containing protein n=1 Tax=Athalassotoga saccharophila TaxID=1441386 RepID=UPI0018D944E5|nr:PLP-dependent aminotransferase family protein [Athalassotoga saccharophila]